MNLKIVPFALLVAAGFSDYMTTTYMLQDPRFYETRAYYVPFLATVILGSAVAVCMMLEKASKTVSWILIAVLVAVAWSAPINNLLLLSAYKE